MIFCELPGLHPQTSSICVTNGHTVCTESSKHSGIRLQFLRFCPRFIRLYCVRLESERVVVKRSKMRMWLLIRTSKKPFLTADSCRSNYAIQCETTNLTSSGTHTVVEIDLQNSTINYTWPVWACGWIFRPRGPTPFQGLPEWAGE